MANSHSESGRERTLSTELLVKFCYESILGRAPDKSGMSAYVQALESGQLTREDLLTTFIRSDEFRNSRQAREHVPPGHFFSALPSDADRAAYLDRTASKEVVGVELNESLQLELVRQFGRYHRECPFPATKSPGYRYWFENPAFSYSDAIVLYSMMRHFEPRQVIEVGSGFSSCVMLDTVAQSLPGTRLTFIEPYPELLETLVSGEWNAGTTLIDLPVQQTDLSVFESLGAGDMLFVDSTHVTKLMSDVNHIFFEVVPRLSSGVLVHFHDIFWPFDYPFEWVQQGRAWNEAYLLRAFLQYNRDFEIVFFGSFLQAVHPTVMSEHLPDTIKNTGGSIWLRRR